MTFNIIKINPKLSIKRRYFKIYEISWISLSIPRGDILEYKYFNKVKYGKIRTEGAVCWVFNKKNKNTYLHFNKYKNMEEFINDGKSISTHSML